MSTERVNLARLGDDGTVGGVNGSPVSAALEAAVQAGALLGGVFPGYRYDLPANAVSSTSTSSNACVVGSDGSSYANGELFISPIVPTAAVVKRTPDAAAEVDTSFGNEGWCLIQPPAITGIVIQGMALDPSGNILISGYAIAASTLPFVARITLAGILDTTFNASGTPGYLIFTPAGSTGATSFGVCADSTGRVYVVGSASVSGNLENFATRLTELGVVDTGYGSGGTALWSPSDAFGNAAWNCTIDGSGNLVVGGAAGPGASTPEAGETFSTTVATASSPTNTAGQKLLKIASVGTMPAGIVAGSAVYIGSGGTAEAKNSVVSIAGGVLTLKNNLAFTQTAGATVVADAGVLTVSRLTSTGVLDTTFNAAGSIPGTNIQTPGGITGSGLTVAIQSTGKILVGGEGFTTFPCPAVMRFNTDGTLDTSFGTAGLAIVPQVGAVNALVLDSSDRIYIASVSSARTTWCSRMTANGTMDSSFGVAGNIPSTAPMFQPNGIAVSTVDGSVTLVGPGTPTGGIQSYGVAKVSSTGLLQYGFPTPAQLGADPAGAAAAEQARAEAAEAALAASTTYLGDGSDGAITFDGTTAVGGTSLAGSTYTLGRDLMATSIEIKSGVTVAWNNFVIFCQGQFLIDAGGSLAMTGGAGAAAGVAGTAAGSASGTIPPALNGAAGNTGAGGNGAAGTSSNGGAGGLGSSGAGGTGGATPLTSTQVLKRPSVGMTATYPTATTTNVLRGGSGGGGGGGDGTNKGGGAGAGGPTCIVFAGSFVNNGTVVAKGGAGGNGTTGNSGGGGGGGGGLVIVYTLAAATMGSVTVTGGANGTKSGTGVVGSNGGAGASLNSVLA